MGLCHDLELAMRVSAYGDVEYIDQALLDYTLRGDSITSQLAHRHIRLGSGSPIVDECAAWLSALRVHEERREVSSVERAAIGAAISRAFIKRALLHRLAPGGRGPVAALLDVARAAKYHPRTVFRTWRLAAACAAVLAPAWLIQRATALGHRRGLVVV
jgi:hypothetical protein